jgi:ammonium transporter, Amt family
VVRGLLGTVAVLAALVGMAPTGQAAEVVKKLDSGDTAWMLVATALVLMMTVPGVALLYGGMVRKKNVLGTVMQSFTVCCLATVIWMVMGYSLAFGAGNAYVGDFSRLFLRGLGIDEIADAAPTIPETVFMMFQMTFAIITPALITGSVADRMKFSALLWFIGFWCILVYAPIAHWVWGGGFMGSAGMGVLDFAGGTVVHINAGVAGLVAAIMLGKRQGYGRENLAPHNLVLTIIGASLLWVGWFGFNAGSALTAGASAGMAMAVTQIATAAAGLAWLFSEWLHRGKPSVLGIASGAIAGLVAITPASGFVGPMGALIIGIVAGIVCFWAVVVVKNKLGYDDSLDAFGIHGVGGIVGALLTGVFAVEAIGKSAGLLEGNGGQLLTQFWGVAITVVYTAIVSGFILLIVDKLVGLRIESEQEREGLDLALHGEQVM